MGQRFKKLENKYLELFDSVMVRKMNNQSYIGDACSSGLNQYIVKICNVEE